MKTTENKGFLPTPKTMGQSMAVKSLVAFQKTNKINAFAHVSYGMALDYVRDLAVGMACAMVISSFKHQSGFPLGHASVHEKFSGFTYSLYLFHFPLTIFCLSSLHQAGIMDPPVGLLEGFVLFIVLAVACLVTCYGLSRLTEAKTPQSRRWLAVRVAG